MSDEKLRELERRFKETGSVEDEAAWLKERVRVGDLTQERLELAAYCGYEGAALATVDRRQASWLHPSPEPWLSRLADRHPESAYLLGFWLAEVACDTSPTLPAATRCLGDARGRIQRFSLLDPPVTPDYPELRGVTCSDHPAATAAYFAVLAAERRDPSLCYESLHFSLRAVGRLGSDEPIRDSRLEIHRQEGQPDPVAAARAEILLHEKVRARAGSWLTAPTS